MTLLTLYSTLHSLSLWWGSAARHLIRRFSPAAWVNWCLTVFAMVSLATSAQAQINNAEFVSQSVPTSMITAQSYNVSVTLRNNGTTTWATGTNHKLGSQNPADNYTWRASNRVELTSSVAPGQQYTFNFTVTAPATTGTYNFQWRMVREFIEWFGATTPNVAVAVTVPPPVDNAAFVTQSVPATMVAGQSYTASVTMKNTGNTTWTSAANYKLGSENPADNYTWRSINRVELTGAVAPGQNHTFNFTVTAPSTPGTYNFRWKMVREYIAWFGALSTNVAITVNSATTPPPAVEVTYFHNDAAGTPMLATNAAGGVLWKETYRPYGERLKNLPASANNQLWFAGKPYDENTGLSYMGARYYDPMLGRFTGVDPIDFDPQNVHSFNRYAYANNNPYKFVDPDGRSPIDVVFLVYDIGKLGVAVYTGVGVGAAAADVALSVVGVASPAPGTGQALKAARAAHHTIEASRVAGKAREAATGRELAEKFGEAAVQREQYLRTADGKIAKDALTGKGRRIDHVVIKDGKAVGSVETTSMTARKIEQAAKEERIRDAGGTHVRDRSTGGLVDFKEVKTELLRLR